MAAPSIQTLLDEAEINAVVELLPGDYGPVELRRPVVLNAHGATFWAVGEHPAVRITTEGVCLQNATLRTAPSAAPSVVFEIAPTAHPTLQGVRVHGGISGLDPNEDKWVLPQRLDAGELKAPISYFILELGASGSARLVSRVSGVEFDPPQLNAGFNEVKMRIRDVSQDSILVGDMELITAHVTRVIPFSARVSQFEAGLASAPVKTLFKVPDARRVAHSVKSASQQAPPQPVPVEPPSVPPISALVPEPTAVVAVSPPAPTASPVASPSSKAQPPQQPIIVAVPNPTPKASPAAVPMHSLVPPPPQVPSSSAGKALSNLFAQPDAPAQATNNMNAPDAERPPTIIGPLFGGTPPTPPNSIEPPTPIWQRQESIDTLSPLFGKRHVPDQKDHVNTHPRVLQLHDYDGMLVSFSVEPTGRGGGRIIFLTSDRRTAVTFFDRSLRERDEIDRKLRSLLHGSNPTVDTRDLENGEKLFCWPFGLINTSREIPQEFIDEHQLCDPPLGFAIPCLEEEFYFRDRSNTLQSKDPAFFLAEKALRLVPDGERGTLASRIECSRKLSMAVERLHAVGIVPADLSRKSFVVNLRDSRICFLFELEAIDLSGFPPCEIQASMGYAAPEVLTGSARLTPAANLHSLAVLIYELLLMRHPLRGPKVNSLLSPKEDEKLSMGTRALFIEHPSDTSNRPVRNLNRTIASFGPDLEKCFLRAFVDGLHTPDRRPTPQDWQAALLSALRKQHKDDDVTL